MPSKIVRRIERDLGIPGLVDALATRLSASDLRSLLMEIYNARAARVNEAQVLAHARRDPLMAPSSVNSRELLRLDSAAFEAASKFAAVDLSPVCPFSAEFTLGGTSQNNVLTAIRNAEALGDPTIALALEAARRRDSETVVRLCASHRVIRLQPFDIPGYTPHFRLFALVTAGRDTGAWRFEITHLLEHVRVNLRMFRLLQTAGFALATPMVEFTDMLALEAALDSQGVSRADVRRGIRAHHLGGSENLLRELGLDESPDGHNPLFEAAVITPLQETFPHAQFRVNQRRLEGLGYYRCFAFRISHEARDGKVYPLVDGGFTDWTARLLSNQKERLLISGLGSEFVCKTYR